MILSILALSLASQHAGYSFAYSIALFVTLFSSTSLPTTLYFP